MLIIGLENTEVGKPKKFGEELGFLEMLGTSTGLIAPILAGIIITIFGFTTLFIISLILRACLKTFKHILSQFLTA